MNNTWRWQRFLTQIPVRGADLRGILLIVLLMPLWSPPGYTQEIKLPRWEIALGLSYENADVLAREDLFGAKFSVNYNFNPKFGFTFDAAAHANEGATVTVDIMSGPRYMKRRKNVTLFGHTLFGARLLVIGAFIEPGVALNLGGGIDVNANKWLSFRVIEASYVPHRLFGHWFHDVRIGSSLVFKIGKGH